MLLNTGGGKAATRSAKVPSRTRHERTLMKWAPGGLLGQKGFSVNGAPGPAGLKGRAGSGGRPNGSGGGTRARGSVRNMSGFVTQWPE